LIDVERHDRGVCIETVSGRVDGALHIGRTIRTLDDLNQESKEFVVVRQPKPDPTGRHLTDAPLALKRTSILFLYERTVPLQMDGKRFGNFRAVPLRMRVGRFHVEGFVHTSADGDAMKRLSESRHPFMALTSVLVESPDGDYTVPFLAVNRDHIIAAQQDPART